MMPATVVKSRSRCGPGITPRILKRRLSSMPDQVKLDGEVPPIPAELAASAVSAPGPYCRNRLFEWIMTAAMLGIAATLVTSPDSLSAGRFSLLIQFGITQPMVMAVVLVTGVLRTVALARNGTWRHGYRARALCALIGAILWALMAQALANSPGPLSIAVSVFIALALGELRSLWRAVTDAGSC